MTFNWINVFGSIMVVLILVPNIIWSIKNTEKGGNTARIPTYLTVMEQIGRYGCMALMVLPLFLWEFGFDSTAGFVVYLSANGALLLCYYAVWVAYGKKKTLKKAIALAFILAVIFVLSAVLLHHTALFIFALIFCYAHTAITVMTHKNI